MKHQLIGPGACDQVAADCALLRSCVWALTSGNRPVHVLRLLNLATSLDSSDGEIRARIKESLEELADSGDLVELANGRWLPAPTRQVRLDTVDDTRLLVGGLPTSLLPSELKAKLEHSGVFRRTKGDFLAKELGLPSEDRASWMGEAPADLRTWTREALEGKYEAYRDGGRQFYVYAPEVFPSTTPQARRWVERLDKLSGKYLCWQDLPLGWRHRLPACGLGHQRLDHLLLRCQTAQEEVQPFPVVRDIASRAHL